jgi:putative oxidoreductase
MKDLGLLAVRAVGGTLLAGHGAQKLFGAFEGPGLQGTASFMEMLGLRPGRPWATAAALSEFGGGTLIALGLLSPLGSIGAISAMAMAIGKAHWGKPIWAAKGGAELPLTNLSIALAVALIGPGAYSLDRVLGLKIPTAVTAAAALSAGALVGYGLSRRPAPQAAPAQAAAPDASTETVEETNEAEIAAEALEVSHLGSTAEKCG